MQTLRAVLRSLSEVEKERSPSLCFEQAFSLSAEQLSWVWFGYLFGKLFGHEHLEANRREPTSGGKVSIYNAHALLRLWQVFLELDKEKYDFWKYLLYLEWAVF